MNLELIKTFFVLSGIIFTILFAIRVLGKFKDAGKLSAFVSVIAISLILYIIFAIILAIFVQDYSHKVILILLAISPFLIGKLVNYEKLKFYSTIQIICAILGVVFVLLI